MYCASSNQFACQCLPQRLKPQTAGREAVFPFSSSFLSQLFRNFQTVFYSIYLQCQPVLFLYRAKNRNHLGLLALFFCVSLEHN